MTLKANEHHIDDELLVKYLLGEASYSEKNAIELWIDASAENHKYFNHFQLIWQTSKQLVVPPSVNADEAWKRFQQKTQEVQTKPAVVKQMRFSSSWMRAASVAILVIGVSIVAYLLNQSAKPTIFATVTSPATDTLSDGSIVTLNKNSSLRYAKNFKGNTRKVQLQGEAFFKVRPNKQKPFVISVNDITVTVVGTSFNIKSTGTETQVVVETGVVLVTRNNKTIELRPNEKLLTKSADTVLAKEKTSDKLYQYYRSKEFVCDNTPLWKLVEVLNEAYGSNIIIAKPELRNLPLTTTFYNESLEKILSVIAETFEISIEHRGDQIVLQ